MSDYEAFREEVTAWVRGRLLSDPVASASDLFAEACERWPALEALSVRQFRVRYTLPVSRSLARDDVERARRRREESRAQVGLPGTESEPEQPSLFGGGT